MSTAAYSPGGQHFVTGSKEPSVTIWEVSTGEMATTWEGEQSNTSQVTSVAYNLDG